MGYWNHRAFRETASDGSHLFSIRETYYNKDGTLSAYTEEPIIMAESVENLREYLNWMLASLDKEVIIIEEAQFVDDDDDSSYGWLGDYE